MIDALELLPEDYHTLFDSRFRIALIASQRARQLMQGAPRRGKGNFARETCMALEEVLHQQVPYLVGEAAREAIKQGRHTTEHDFDPALLVQTNEDAKEIKKELSVYIDDSPKVETPPEPEEGK